MATAERESAIPYDVKDVELGHVDGRCSFESIMVKCGLEDPALKRLAQIVHGADVVADRNNCPEAPGLYAIAHGLRFIDVAGSLMVVQSVSTEIGAHTTAFDHSAGTGVIHPPT
jgi:hypothetical protein